MGRFSELAIEEAERRFLLRAVDGRNVCPHCFADPHLAFFVTERASALACDYCGESSDQPIAAPLPDVVEFMVRQIELEYASADQSLPVDPDTKERMFAEEEFDGRELLETYVELQLPRDHRGRLMEDIAAALSDHDWCLINPLGAREEDAIGGSWDTFKTIVKHRRRFFFLQHEDQALEDARMWGEAAFDVPGLLERIAVFCRDHDLIIAMDEGTRWCRVQRLGDGEQNFGSRRMGPPPYDLATMPNRMSPAGVPMFYGAATRSTALAEVAGQPGRYASGIFETGKEILLLDVRAAPPVPSLFDPRLAKDRSVAMFMHAFIEDFRTPIDRERLPHVDYLPTQVITEYFRTMVRDEHGRPMEGVLYTSTRDGGDAVVLFAEADDVIDDAPEAEAATREWLRMIEYEEVEVPAA